MRRILLALTLGLALFAKPIAAPAAQTYPHCPPGVAPLYVHGFHDLHAALGETMGDPLECEHTEVGTGDAFQRTTRGLAYYHIETNAPIFTDGYHRWAWTAAGLVHWAGEALDPPPPTPTPVPTRGPLVSLTFDAGADRGYAEDILDLLLAEGVPASFGLTGTWASANPDLVRRIAAEGHHVINHTLTHRSFTGLSDNRGGLSPAQRRAELEQADAILAPLIGGTTAPWYRLPYGDDDVRVATDVAPSGYTRKAGWTIDSAGWRGISAAEIVERCLRLAHPNAVYVFHVGRSSQDGPALGRLIDGLRAQGYRFVTMRDLP
jgi:peptidoglycan-N-acetylglucosamine deacetylase